MELTQEVVATAAMLIRKPAARVFQAFVDPDVTTKFWFDKSSGPLESGKTVRWHWGPASAEVHVKGFEQNEQILIEWGPDAENVTTVEWTFTSRSADSTHVSITHRGFRGDGDEIVRAALDSKGGFTSMLAAAKAYLEHNIQLNVVADK